MLRVKRDENSITLLVDELISAHGKEGRRVGRRFIHAMNDYFLAKALTILDPRDAASVPDAVRHLQDAAGEVTGLCPALNASPIIRVIRAIPEEPDGRTTVSILHTDFAALAI